MRLTERFEQALVYAKQTHDGQLRKGTEIPYIAHLLGVASLVLEDGGNEDEAIAALLHDAVEDQGGKERLQDVRDRFGEDVARIVSECSDADVTPKPPWRKRKEAYVRHLLEASPEAVRVSLADKLYNAQSILVAYRTIGDEVWSRFNEGKDEQLWYYLALVNAFKERRRGPMVDSFARVVSELATELKRDSVRTGASTPPP